MLTAEIKREVDEKYKKLAKDSCSVKENLEKMGFKVIERSNKKNDYSNSMIGKFRETGK